jgi:DNA-directed RNA polymerase beta' subunit
MNYPHLVDELGNLFKVETLLERIDLDKEKDNDLRTGNGFIIFQHQNIKKDLKEPNGIFSTRFGSTLNDSNPFINKYKCSCGYTMGKINNGMTCPICNTKVKFVDDNYDLFGWTVLKDEYCIIHPNLYKELETIIGTEKLYNIIKPIDNKNEDGFTIEENKQVKDEPYKGKGILWLRDNFETVLDYYYNNSSNKKAKTDTYLDLLENKDKIFTHSIPIFTTLLRPFKLDGGNFVFNDINGLYNMIVKLVHDINMNTLRIHRKKKPKLQLLYDLQYKLNKVYAEVENILSGKKGIFRGVFGGRFNFSSRCVIIPDDTLKVDQVKLSYFALVGLLEQRIINVLVKSYNMSYDEAHNIWYYATIQEDQRVRNIIQSLIDDGQGIPILINRPICGWVLPTEMYGEKPCELVWEGLMLNELQRNCNR